MSGRWPARIFTAANSSGNHAARSTSGNSCCRPDFGGHSIVNVVLCTADASRSPSTAQAVTTLPPAWRTGVSGRNGPSTLEPGFLAELAPRRVERRLARFVAALRESTRRPMSLRDQNGPPGWTSSTSSPAGRRRKSSNPALCCRTVSCRVRLAHLADASDEGRAPGAAPSPSPFASSLSGTSPGVWMVAKIGGANPCARPAPLACSSSQSWCASVGRQDRHRQRRDLARAERAIVARRHRVEPQAVDGLGGAACRAWYA